MLSHFKLTATVKKNLNIHNFHYRMSYFNVIFPVEIGVADYNLLRGKLKIATPLFLPS
jgi:hypothetical protein